MSRAALTRRIALGSLALLVALQLLIALFERDPVVIWVARLLPLLVFIPGLIADKLRSYIWLCLVSLLYFVSLVLRLFAYPDDMVAILAMISVVTLFMAPMLYVRWRARELRPSGTQPETLNE